MRAFGISPTVNRYRCSREEFSKAQLTVRVNSLREYSFQIEDDQVVSTKFRSLAKENVSVFTIENTGFKSFKSQKYDFIFWLFILYLISFIPLMYIFHEESFCSFLICQFIGVTVLHANPEWFYLWRHFHSHKEYYRCKRPMQLSDRNRVISLLFISETDICQKATRDSCRRRNQLLLHASLQPLLPHVLTASHIYNVDVEKGLSWFVFDRILEKKKNLHW